ncbi:hypothetical protein GTO91_08630 [Heliobacterium undosum]|uniref:Uncharacterized protein n=1 Tax=Heliomicrobium undosum TaxID=121734 RepID=A0A845L3Q5_9FIRM|nr:hypothetical protein [Heliomicrobium undosum]MZP29769.1 hypothetical protein [Heliomicrobium undosum]
MKNLTRYFLANILFIPFYFGLPVVLVMGINTFKEPMDYYFGMPFVTFLLAFMIALIPNFIVFAVGQFTHRKNKEEMMKNLWRFAKITLLVSVALTILTSIYLFRTITYP